MRNTLFLKYPDRKNYFFLINLSSIERIWKFLEAWESERSDGTKWKIKIDTWRDTWREFLKIILYPLAELRQYGRQLTCPGL